MKTKIVRFIFTLMLVASVLGGSASAVLADTPLKYDWVASAALTVTDLCPFPVSVVATYQITEHDFFDTNGALERIHNHIIAQDTYTANGNLLVGIPYILNTEFLFDSSGQLLHYYVVGVYEKILLPDGSLFVTAGRTDLIKYPGVDFTITPDKGNQGNIAGFCAALAQ